MKRRSVAVIMASCVLVCGVLVTSCRTNLTLRVQRVEIGGPRPAMIPEDRWESPGMVVFFTCDEGLNRLASRNSVVLVASGNEGAEAVGLVFCRGLVMESDDARLRELGTRARGDRAAFLGVFRLDRVGGRLAESIQEERVDALSFVVHAGGSYIEWGESNEVIVRRDDPRWNHFGK